VTQPELMGARVQLAPAPFAVAEPLMDVSFPEGVGRIVADRDRTILRVTGVGTFAIENGRRISIDPEPDAPANAVATWLHGTVAAFLLAQRRQFALHANVIEIDGSAVAVAGAREAGKSTTALRLAQRGHTLVTDDVSPLTAGARVTVHPFTRPVHVWPQAAQALELELSGAQPMLPDSPKLALPAGSRAPAEVAAISVLQVSETADIVAWARVRGAQTHGLVAANIYRVRMLSPLCRAEMFAWASAVASSVPVYVVTRPPKGWTVDAVADAVEQIAAAHASDRYPKRPITSP
jgi:hypothetical protein